MRLDQGNSTGRCMCLWHISETLSLSKRVLGMHVSTDKEEQQCPRQFSKHYMPLHRAFKGICSSDLMQYCLRVTNALVAMSDMASPIETCMAIQNTFRGLSLVDIGK